MFDVSIERAFASIEQRLDRSDNQPDGAAMTRNATWESDTGLKRYLAQIRAIPLLWPGEEIDLARRYKKQGDRRALDRMVGSHLRLVVKTALGYRGYGLPLAELVSEGSIGLVRAVEGFDPDKGFRFATYAIWWIKAAMQEYIVRSRSLVKMGTTTGERKLFFGLRKTKARLSMLADGDMSPQDATRIAEHLGVSEREVVEMNRRLGGDVSLNSAADDGVRSAWQDQLPDETPSQEDVLADQEQIANGRAALAEALTLLNDRERRVLVWRRLTDKPKRLAEIASEIGVSRERVRQIEAVAFEKVRKAIRHETPAVRPVAPIGQWAMAAA
jgi:RNA polymerase sigma-32 factor